MAFNFKKSAANGKTRSKSAKIVLWSLLGAVCVNLLILLIMFIVAASGGTGTSFGGLLGIPFDICTTILTFLIVILVLVWLLTEPSFKKVEEVEDDLGLDYRNQYVKKAANPHPMSGKASTEDKAAPAEESKDTTEKQSDN